MESKDLTKKFNPFQTQAIGDARDRMNTQPGGSHGYFEHLVTTTYLDTDDTEDMDNLILALEEYLNLQKLLRAEWLRLLKEEQYEIYRAQDIDHWRGTPLAWALDPAFHPLLIPLRFMLEDQTLDDKPEAIVKYILELVELTHLPPLHKLYPVLESIHEAADKPIHPDLVPLPRIRDIKIPRLRQLALITYITIGGNNMPDNDEVEGLLDTPLEQAFDGNDTMQGGAFWDHVEEGNYDKARSIWDWGQDDYTNLNL